MTHMKQKSKNSNILCLVLEGQCPSGKNAVGITKSGRRYPSKRFAAWRASCFEQIKKQLPKKFQQIKTDCNVTLDYYAGDLRKRDTPGIIDAVWNVLENYGATKGVKKSGLIVSDDYYLGGATGKVSYASRGLDRQNPRIYIILHW